MTPIKNAFFILLTLCCAFACNDLFVPRPKGYPKIFLPPKHYRMFERADYPFRFMYPTYAVYEKDSHYLHDKNAQYWMNLSFPSLNGTLYLTYKSLQKESIEQLIYESFKLTNKQIYKATSIEKKQATTPNGYQVVYFHVGGDAATTHQFFLTDKKKHFLRGALYFNTTPNEDSLKILNDFLLTDIQKMAATLQFK